uniref:Uncharacterized protein n=1 Tax=Ditylenchus dipsaci TaxID=166011 RepID=A0A915DYD9_9BILA
MAEETFSNLNGGGDKVTEQDHHHHHSEPVRNVWNTKQRNQLGVAVRFDLLLLLVGYYSPLIFFGNTCKQSSIQSRWWSVASYFLSHH